LRGEPRPLHLKVPARHRHLGDTTQATTGASRDARLEFRPECAQCGAEASKRNPEVVQGFGVVRLLKASASVSPLAEVLAGDRAGGVIGWPKQKTLVGPHAARSLTPEKGHLSGEPRTCSAQAIVTRERGEGKLLKRRDRLAGFGGGPSGQQVTWRMALVSAACRFSSSIASAVGTTISSTLRRAASCFTCSITGRAVACANDEAATAPGDAFLDGNRCVAEEITELLGWFLFAFANLTPVDHDIMVVSLAINPNGPEGERVEPHKEPLPTVRLATCLLQSCNAFRPSFLLQQPYVHSSEGRQYSSNVAKPKPPCVPRCW
jgi:hypothetical protein